MIGQTGRGDGRIRVLRVIARMNMGGPAYHVGLLGGRLDPDRYDTLLISGRVGPGEGSLEYIADHYGARLRRLDALSPIVHPRSDVLALRTLVQIVREFQPDIVHTHTSKAGVLGRVAARALRRRPIVVHTYHGHVLEGYFGTARSATYRNLERALARSSDCLIGVSRATVDDLVRLRVAPADRFRVIPIGLELDAFRDAEPDAGRDFRAALGASRDEVVATCVGRLVPIKRLQLAIGAVARARGAGARLRLAVVGDGESRSELEAFASARGLGGAVTFTGYRRDLPAVVAGSDLAILSSDNEGTPVALIEAAAGGRPSVATSVGGVPEVVAPGTGLLVPRGDERAMAEALARLVADPSGRAAMGHAAASHVLHRFSAARLLESIDALYRELVQRRGVRL